MLNALPGFGDSIPVGVRIIASAYMETWNYGEYPERWKRVVESRRWLRRWFGRWLGPKPKSGYKVLKLPNGDLICSYETYGHIQHLLEQHGVRDA